MSNLMLKVVSKLTGSSVKQLQQVGFIDNIDQDMINQVGAIIMQIVALFKSCKPPEEAVKVSHNPKTSDERRVKRVVRQELGFFKNLREGDKYVKAVLDAGKETTVEDFKEVW